MKWRSLLLIVALVTMDRLALGECGAQDYDSETAPDFSCPGPEELGFAPELNPPASIPVGVGWSLMNDRGQLVAKTTWEGALVHRDRLVEVGMKLQTVRRLRWADRLRLRQEYDLNLRHSEEVADVRLGVYEAQVNGYREQVLAQERQIRSAQAWYRSWWFGFTLGVICSALVVGLTTYVISAI